MDECPWLTTNEMSSTRSTQCKAGVPFRIQVRRSIEYAPQQGDIDHIHTIYRDPTNDYSRKKRGCGHVLNVNSRATVTLGFE